MYDQLPPNLVDKTGKLRATREVLKDKKVVAFYFSAHWCPPCRQFTPVLARSYDQARQAGLAGGVELIFVSSDRSEQEMMSYLRESHGNWYALPHGASEAQSLSSQYGVRGIPALVVVAMDGTVVSRDGRQEVTSLGMSAFSQWESLAPADVDTSVVLMLRDNPEEVKRSACDILTKLLTNIINDPNNTKYRAVKLTNKTIEEKLLPASGAFEVLFSVGFEEADDKLLLPLDANIRTVEKFRDAVVNVDKKVEPSVRTDPVPASQPAPSISSSSSFPSSSSSSSSSSVANPRPAATTVNLGNLTTRELEFNAKLQSCLAHMDSFEDPAAQAAALSVMPVEKLEKQAREKFQAVKAKDPSLKEELYRDLLLLEFKEWFKTDFFSWVDSPPCPSCDGPTQSCGMGTPTPQERADGAGRVEIYKCDKCNLANIRFARYHGKPAKLLETRRGRCGEWANCFVLCCRALGFETRHVLDWTDHVWSEVWSQAENRWLHVDPGETVDKPLVYEAGWGKKLTYVIAFSREEIQDVTWRYSKDHTETRRRRVLVRPSWLVRRILELSKARLARLEAERRTELTERRLAECLEMLTPRSVTAGDQVGRQTGSLAWRLARGEAGQQRKEEGWVWSPQEEAGQVMEVSYDVVRDRYSSTNTAGGEREGWSAGVWRSENIQRKVETDWNMAYLARVEGSDREQQGEIEWRLKVREGETISRVVLRVESTVYHGASVRWQLCGGDICLMPRPGTELDTNQLAGATQISLQATLLGGEGDNAWQHTQLFRSSRTEEKQPDTKFKLVVYFKRA